MKYPKVSKEEREQRARDRAYRKQEREYALEEKKSLQLKKLCVKRELQVLEFMKKTDVKYYHHSEIDSMLPKILHHIEILKKKDANWVVYDPYIWNYQGEGNNYTSRCLLSCLWRRSKEFPTIYDVPLDGSYEFAIMDSGQRGLGSYDYIKAVKVNEEIIVPKVNPGAFRPF